MNKQEIINELKNRLEELEIIYHKAYDDDSFASNYMEEFDIEVKEGKSFPDQVAEYLEDQEASLVSHASQDLNITWDEMVEIVHTF